MMGTCQRCGKDDHHGYGHKCISLDELRRLQSQVTQLEHENAALKRERLGMADIIEQLSKEKKAVEAELDRLKGQQGEAVQLRLAEMKDQLTKAEQLWQVAQGRCDGLEEKLAKAEQREEWQPIETEPKDNTVFLAWRKHATHPLMVRYEPSYDWFANYDGEHVYGLTHWMPLPKPPAMMQGEQQ